jgi:phosphomevalonate kinase
MIETSAPGKLMLSGEWSVLEIGVPCIVMAIDDRVTCRIAEKDTLTLNAPDVGLENVQGKMNGKKVEWETSLTDKQQDTILVPQHVIQTTHSYIAEKGIFYKPFSLSTSSKISEVTVENGNREKVGFGSSAAAAVAMTAAILKLHGVHADKPVIYKLACTAHYLAQGKVGSSFDVAASTYGGVTVYTRFDGKWLADEIESGKSIATIVESNWKAFTAYPLTLPSDFHLAVGFVGYGSSTKVLVTKLHKEFKANHREAYDAIIAEMKTCTENVIAAIKQNNQEDILKYLKENKTLLSRLSSEANAGLDTPELSTLSTIANTHNHAVGKFSGSGGGDCGIAVSFSSETNEQIKSEWKAAGLYPLDVKIAQNGVI